MSLGTQVVRAVQKEAAMQRPLPLSARARSTLPKGGSAEVEVVLHDNDRFSHMADAIKVKSHPAKAGARKPEANAKAFCDKTTYLTERLRFVESDASGAAVVRSTPETMREKRAEYYEAKVGSDEISLQRFKPNPTGPGREAVPFCVTDETLARIVDDATQVLTQPPKKS